MLIKIPETNSSMKFIANALASGYKPDQVDDLVDQIELVASSGTTYVSPATVVQSANFAFNGDTVQSV